MARFTWSCWERHVAQALHYRPVLEQLEQRDLLTYTIANLATLSGGTYSVATAINASGDVAGYADTLVNGTLYTHAFLYKNGALTDLETLVDNNAANSHAYAINSNDAVAGDTQVLVYLPGVGNTLFTHAFRKPLNQLMQDLHTLIASPDQDKGTSTATGINDAGNVSGKSNYDQALPNNYDAFWYDGSTMHDFQSADYGPNTYANAIDNNSSPVLVGSARGYQDLQHCDASMHFGHAYGWTATDPVTQYQIGPGTLPEGEEAHAFGINAGGVVVGDSSIGYICSSMPPPHAFAATPSSNTYSYTQLDYGVTTVSESRAFGINGNADSYTVVGQYDKAFPPSGNMTDSFVYNWNGTSGGFTDLQSLLSSHSGWSHLLAFGINSSGQIVGQGTYADPLLGSVTRAFLITPTASPNGSGGSNSPTLGAPILSQSMSSQGILLSGVPANTSLGSTSLNVPAVQPLEQNAATGTSVPRVAVPTAFPLLPLPSPTDLLSAAPSLEWIGDLAMEPLG